VVKEVAILFSKDLFPGNFPRIKVIPTTETKSNIVMPAMK
jgi:hypothetical protein